MALAIVLFGWLASVAPREFLGHFTVFTLGLRGGLLRGVECFPCAAHAADVGHQRHLGELSS